MVKRVVFVLLMFVVNVGMAREYHVAVDGNDLNAGTIGRPLRTISAGARLAAAGDVVTVHGGVYREQVAQVRGGESDTKRIVYRAGNGEKVTIKGSEVIKGWQKLEGDVWKVTIPSSFFGKFNPYSDLIKGDWFDDKGREHHTGAVYLNGQWLREAAKMEDVLNFKNNKKQQGADSLLWYARVDEKNTNIWAQFGAVNPNEAEVEINVRRAVFYPERPGVNFITVRGFEMMQAATPWAPPTAEQVGLIGTHWSKGWIIEENVIRYSTCVGVTLGKYGDERDNKGASAEGYVDTIKRAAENGWSKEKVGGHIVRNNRISDCGQAGIAGSLGAVFSEISGNEIHDIHVRQDFGGAEMAGIKIHGAIDTVISGNHIYRTDRGIWLDWMAQGTRVSGNFLHDNSRHDLFVEVNHGPIAVDNNVFVSKISLFDRSEGGAYLHNLFAGEIRVKPDLLRQTPFMEAHSTKIAGMKNIEGGDNRFYNNIFAEPDELSGYKLAGKPNQAGGNVCLKGSKVVRGRRIENHAGQGIRVVEEKDGFYLHLTIDKNLAETKCQLVTSEMLGKTMASGLGFEQADGKPFSMDRDSFGRKRDNNPAAGPFEEKRISNLKLKISRNDTGALRFATCQISN